MDTLINVIIDLNFRLTIASFGFLVGADTLHCRCWEIAYGDCHRCMYELGCEKYGAIYYELYKVANGMPMKKFKRRIRGILFAKNMEQVQSLSKPVRYILAR